MKVLFLVFTVFFPDLLIYLLFYFIVIASWSSTIWKVLSFVIIWRLVLFLQTFRLFIRYFLRKLDFLSYCFFLFMGILYRFDIYFQVYCSLGYFSLFAVIWRVFVVFRLLRNLFFENNWKLSCLTFLKILKLFLFFVNMLFVFLFKHLQILINISKIFNYFFYNYQFSYCFYSHVCEVMLL